MRIFSYAMSKAVVNSFGLNYPESFQLHAFTRASTLLNVYNFMFGKSVPYIVWRHNVHLSTPGLYQLSPLTLNLDTLRSQLQECERAPWKSLLHSVRS